MAKQKTSKKKVTTTKTARSKQTKRKVKVVKKTTQKRSATKKVTQRAASTRSTTKKTVRLKAPVRSASESLAHAIAEAGLDTKAESVEIIDVRDKVDYADFVVVMSGRSDRQVSAIARNIEDTIRKRLNVKCKSVEGLGQAVWVLMDYSDVIVHIFHEDTRSYYSLESLWLDASRIRVPALRS